MFDLYISFECRQTELRNFNGGKVLNTPRVPYVNIVKIYRVVKVIANVTIIIVVRVNHRRIGEELIPKLKTKLA